MGAVHFFEEIFDRRILFDTRCVNPNGLHVPSVILAVHDILPSRQDETLHVRRSFLYSATVFGGIGTHDFDVHIGRIRIPGRLPPSIAGQLPGIDGVGDDDPSQAQILGGHAVANGVT